MSRDVKKRVLIFGGTTEGRELTRRGLPAIYSTATQYGADLAEENENTTVISGRMDAEEIEKFIKSRDVACVIDATHPYARLAREEIKNACAAAGTPLLRVERRTSDVGDDVIKTASAAAAAEYLKDKTGNILLTTGSKELDAFSVIEDRSRLFARVLPDVEAIKKCGELGIDAGHIIAMQGPFSLNMNEETLRMTGARWLVTKDGGAPGGVEEKLVAARLCGANIVMIERPCETRGRSVEEAILWSRRILGLNRPPLFPLLTDMEGRSAVIAGGGRVAARRAATLIKCGAKVTVVSPELSPNLDGAACEIKKREWRAEDLEGAYIAVAATDDRRLNAAVASEAKRRGIPVSVADDAASCSFFFPSLVTCGEVSVSVSAGALSPSLTRRLADRLRGVWDEWVKEEREAQEGGNNG